MACNSFLNSVIRGFGSQIGRDSAKVLTNSMYGNAHATPYRNTSSEIEVDLNSHYEKLTQDELDELNSTYLDDWCQKYNCVYSIKGNNEISKVYYIIWIFLCLMGPFGMIIALYKGYKHYNLKKKQIMCVILLNIHILKNIQLQIIEQKQVIEQISVKMQNHGNIHYRILKMNGMKKKSHQVRNILLFHLSL